MKRIAILILVASAVVSFQGMADPLPSPLPIPSPANNFNGLTGDALETAVKAYYAQQADKQAAAAIQRVQAASQDPVQLAQQVTQLQAENARLKVQLAQTETQRDNFIKLYQDSEKKNQELKQKAARLELVNEQNIGTTQPADNKIVVTQANDVLADFDRSEEDAKRKYAAESIQLQGRIVSFVYDSFGNGDITMIFAQSENHKIAVRFSQSQLKNIPFPANFTSRYGIPKLVHYNPDLKAIVGNGSVAAGGSTNTAINNIIIYKEGDLVTTTAKFDQLDQLQSAAIFNAN